MDNFPSNSHLTRQPNAPASPEPVDGRIDPEKIVLDKVVTGKVTRRKKPMMSRIAETLFHGDTSVFGYLVHEVMIPGAKDILTTIVTQGIEKALYGDVRTTTRPSRGSGHPGMGQRTTMTPYDRPGAIRPHAAGGSAVRPFQRSATDVGDVVVGTKIEAQNIIQTLYDTTEQYGAATVGHLNNLIGEAIYHTDHNYGWTDLTNLTARRVSGGYLILLPPVEVLR